MVLVVMMVVVLGEGVDWWVEAEIRRAELEKLRGLEMEDNLVRTEDMDELMVEQGAMVGVGVGQRVCKATPLVV